MSTTERLWQRVLQELATHPKQIDPDALASTDGVLHRRLSPQVVAALKREKPSLSLVFAWARARELKRALGVAEQLKSKAGEYARALRFIAIQEVDAAAPPVALTQLTTMGVDALGDIALAFVRRGQHQKALSLAARIKNDTSALFAYQAMTDEFFKAHNVPLARTCLVQAFALAEKHQEATHALWYLVPLQRRVSGSEDAQQRVKQVSTWRDMEPLDLAQALASAGDREGARQQFALAEQQYDALVDSQRRLDRYCSLAEAQIRVQEPQAAVATLARAIHLAGEIADESNDKLGAIAGIVRAQAQVGDISGAKKTALLFPYPEVRAYLLVAIGSVQAEQHDLLGSRQTFTEATRIVLLHSEQKARFAFNVIEDQASSGDGLGAWQNLQLVQKHLGAKANKGISYLAPAMVSALVASGETERALQLLPSIPDSGDRVAVLCRGILAKHDPSWEKAWSTRYGTAICCWSWVDMNAVRA